MKRLRLRRILDQRKEPCRVIHRRCPRLLADCFLLCGNYEVERARLSSKTARAAGDLDREVRISAGVVSESVEILKDPGGSAAGAFSSGKIGIGNLGVPGYRVNKPLMRSFGMRAGRAHRSDVAIALRRHASL